METKRKAPKTKKNKRQNQQVDVVKSYFGRSLKNQISSLNGRLIGFPDRLRTKLKWDENYPFNGASGIVTSQVWRGNSIFDPDFTGIFSTTPAYYNAFKDVYGFYLVLGAKIVCRCVNLVSTTGVNILLAASDIRLDSFTFQQNCEAKRSKNILLGISTGSSIGTLKMANSSEEMQGQRELEADSANYSAMTANPADQWYYTMQVESDDNATTSAVRVQITMEFDVVFKELTAFATSKGKNERYYEEIKNGLRDSETGKLFSKLKESSKQEDPDVITHSVLCKCKTCVPC